MKLARFEPKAHGAPSRVGAVVQTSAGHGVIDLARHLPGLPADMVQLLAAWDAHGSSVAELVAAGKPDHALADVTLQAPVPRPGKILGIGLNYADHVRETGHTAPTEQLWFAKMPTSAAGPFDPVQLPLVSSQLDYEAELAIVIGRRCKHVAPEAAHRVIFGYCAANDVSVRDWQRRTSQFILGKSFDGHAPFGPWIVTGDEVGDPHTLDIRCTVNGEVRQLSNTRELIFNCYEQVALLSQCMTLEPGDVLLTGTPGGVGAAFKPPRWLEAGDVVRVEIERIGGIENTVQPERLNPD